MPCLGKIRCVRSGTFSPNAIASIALLLAACVLAGCSSSRRAQYQLPEETLIAQPPVFLTGPAAVLLTNANAFSARLTIDRSGASDKVQTDSGQLLGQGNHLIYAPTGSDKIYIWDTQRHSGYILSEALQGYAPFSSAVVVTKVTTVSEVAGPVSATINGHPGHEAQVVIAANDGSTNTFSVWRASDLNDFPVLIKTLNGPVAYRLTLSLVRSENFAAKLFLPPEGFTKYASVEAIANELLARKVKLRNPGNGGSSDFARPTAAPSPRPY